MSELLPTTAEMALTLAGFAGLFVAFSSRSAGLAPIERYALLFLLFSSLGAALLSTLPYVLLSFTGLLEIAPWFCLCTGSVLIAINIWSAFTPLRKPSPNHPRRYPWLRRILMPIQWLVTGLQLAPFFTDVPAAAVYSLAVWWLLLMAAIQFVMQIAAATKTKVAPDAPR